MPVENRELGARLTNDLFMDHLPMIITQRYVEFDLSDEDLKSEVVENVNFYRWLLKVHAEAASALGENLCYRIEIILGSIEEEFALNDRAIALETARAASLV